MKFIASRYRETTGTPELGTCNLVRGEYANVRNFIRYRLNDSVVAPGSYCIEAQQSDGSYQYVCDAYKRV